MTDTEKEIVDKINYDIHNEKVIIIGGKSITMLNRYSKEELTIWKKYNNNYSELICTSSGELGHSCNKSNRIGVYTPREGFYKIVEYINNPIFAKSGLFVDFDKYSLSAPQVNTTNGDDRQINIPIYAYYDLYFHDVFSSDIVLIDGKPLFNNASNGPRSPIFSTGTIIHVKSTKLSENNTYAIDWDIL